jgi:hypothetical protein
MEYISEEGMDPCQTKEKTKETIWDRVNTPRAFAINRSTETPSVFYHIYYWKRAVAELND